MTLQEYNDLYKMPLKKSMRLVFSGGNEITNENIVQEKMSLEKSLCSEENLRFGRCEAACFKIQIADVNHDFTGEWVTVYQTIDTDEDGYLLAEDGRYITTEDGLKIQIADDEMDAVTVTIGFFKVYSDKPDNDRRWRNLTCYDVMKDILEADVSAWYKAQTFPMQLDTFRDSLFQYLVNTLNIPVVQGSGSLINDSVSIQGGFVVDGTLSGKTIIEAICEFNGVFGQMDIGTFQYVSLGAQSLTLDYYVDGTGSYEDYVTDPITGVNARGTSEDVGTSVGTASNVYTIFDNPLVYGLEGTQALTTVLQRILTKISSYTFRPFAVQTYGNPMLPLGTSLTINTRNQIIQAYVISKTMTGIQGLRDNLSAKSQQHQAENINSTQNQISRSKGKMHELRVDVNGLSSRATAIESDLANNYSTTTQTESLIQQSATNILTSVSQTYVTQADYDDEIQNLQDQIDGRVDTYTGSAVPTLSNYPANTWTTDAEKRRHIGDLYLVNDQGGTYAGRYYRFNFDNATSTFGWILLDDSDVTRALREAEEANAKADAAQAQLDDLEDNIADNYSTTSQMNSAISQSASSITSSVAQTYETKSDATSKFNTADANAQEYASDALSTANTIAQGYANNALTTARSEISQSASSITSSVAQTYETKADATTKQTNLQSQITQSANQIVLKVDNNGNIVKVALDSDPSGGTQFKVQAKNISFIANDKIEMTTNNIAINSTYFKVSKTGALTSTSGNIGGWNITATQLSKEVSISGVTYRPLLNAPASPTENSIAFAIVRTEGGTNTSPFRVNYDGTTTLTKLIATGGTVGGWTLSGTQIRKNVTIGEATYSTILNAPDTPSTSTFAFAVVKAQSGSNTYPFRINYDGAVTATNLTATGGTVGGWTISSGKIYGGDSSTGVAVVQKPSSNTNWTFASGGNSHSSYDNCPFRVHRSGGTYVSSLFITHGEGSTPGREQWGPYISLTSFDTSTGIDLYGSEAGKHAFISADGTSSFTEGMNVYGGLYGSGGVEFTSTEIHTKLTVSGSLTVSGTKSRIAKTKDYGDKALYCYETPSPMFGDVGEGKIAEDGKCYVWIDSTFSETIKTESYQVFLQKYGKGECYVTERTQRYFVVEGTPDMSFGWELKARQAGFENLRLETFNKDELNTGSINYGEKVIDHLNKINHEREVA